MEKPILKFENFSTCLLRPVDSSSLGAFRMIFGLCLVWAMAKFFYRGWIKSKYIDREFHFTYPYFDWVTPLPGDGMYILFAVVGIAALMIAVGLYYRIASVVFFLGYTYIFLLDQVEYNNHYYLICLMAFLFCFTHANRWMAVDCLLKQKAHNDKDVGYVPYWNVLIFKAQILLVYFYGGIAKINMDWLRGEPMRGWFKNWVEFDLDLPRFFASEEFIYFFCYGGLIFDLVIGFLLWSRKTRVLGFLLLLVFHLTNHWMFTIGVFPFLMLGATVFFLEPETPRKFVHDIFPSLNKKPIDLGEKKAQFPILATAFVAIYLTVQILVPLRHWLYPGNVAWTDEGHNYAWRMKLRTKEHCALNLMATNLETGETWPMFPKGILDFRQFNIMCGEPKLIVQYAHYLGKRLQDEGGVKSPVIRAISKVSLNYRPHQTLIDPKVNLLEVDTSPFRHAEWIVPLKER